MNLRFNGLSLFRRTLILLFLLVIATAISGRAGDTLPADVRNVRWGMSKAQVQQVETRAHLVDQDATGLYYAGEGSNVLYTFKAGKLVQVIEQFTHQGESTAKIRQAYSTLNEYLVGKYGDPSTRSATETEGVLEYDYQYKTERTRIAHFLKGTELSLRHALIYMPR